MHGGTSMQKVQQNPLLDSPSPTKEVDSTVSLRITTGMVLAFLGAILGFIMYGRFGAISGLFIAGIARVVYTVVSHYHKEHNHKKQHVYIS